MCGVGFCSVIKIHPFKSTETDQSFIHQLGSARLCSIKQVACYLCASELCFMFLSSSDRTVKIWRARGGLDSTIEVVDNADEVASN